MLKVIIAAVLFGGAVEIVFLDMFVKLIPSHGVRLGLAFGFAMIAQNILAWVLSVFGLSAEAAKVTMKVELQNVIGTGNVEETPKVHTTELSRAWDILHNIMIFFAPALPALVAALYVIRFCTNVTMVGLLVFLIGTLGWVGLVSQLMYHGQWSRRARRAHVLVTAAGYGLAVAAFFLSASAARIPNCA